MALTGSREALTAYRKWFPTIQITALCGYNPQLLLTYKPKTLMEFATGGLLGETYMPNDEINLMLKRETTFPKGRLIYPTIKPKSEIVDPPYDFGQERSRMHRKAACPTISYITINPSKLADYKIEINANTEQFHKVMELHQARLAEFQDRLILQMIYGEQAPPFPKDHFNRERRIAKLLMSKDRRQKKRGERLFKAWRASRPGINWTRDEKRELYRRGYGNTSHYRKD